SQAQTPPPPASWRRIASRVGSAAPWSRRTSGSFERFTVRTVLTDIDIVKYQYRPHQLRRSAMTTETIHEEVRSRYAAAATQAIAGGCCSGDPETIGAELYSAMERAELPDAAVLASLGCG